MGPSPGQLNYVHFAYRSGSGFQAVGSSLGLGRQSREERLLSSEIAVHSGLPLPYSGGFFGFRVGAQDRSCVLFKPDGAEEHGYADCLVLFDDDGRPLPPHVIVALLLSMDQLLHRFEDAAPRQELIVAPPEVHDADYRLILPELVRLGMEHDEIIDALVGVLTGREIPLGSTGGLGAVGCAALGLLLMAVLPASIASRLHFRGVASEAAPTEPFPPVDRVGRDNGEEAVFHRSDPGRVLPGWWEGVLAAPVRIGPDGAPVLDQFFESRSSWPDRLPLGPDDSIEEFLEGLPAIGREAIAERLVGGDGGSGAIRLAQALEVVDPTIWNELYRQTPALLRLDAPPSLTSAATAARSAASRPEVHLQDRPAPSDAMTGENLPTARTGPKTQQDGWASADARALLRRLCQTSQYDEASRLCRAYVTAPKECDGWHTAKSICSLADTDALLGNGLWSAFRTLYGENRPTVAVDAFVGALREAIDECRASEQTTIALLLDALVDDPAVPDRVRTALRANSTSRPGTPVADGVRGDELRTAAGRPASGDPPAPRWSLSTGWQIRVAAVTTTAIVVGLLVWALVINPDTDTQPTEAELQATALVAVDEEFSSAAELGTQVTEDANLVRTTVQISSNDLENASEVTFSVRVTNTSETSGGQALLVLEQGGTVVDAARAATAPTGDLQATLDAAPGSYDLIVVLLG